jgi:hypothetical protein
MAKLKVNDSLLFFDFFYIESNLGKKHAYE